MNETSTLYLPCMKRRDQSWDHSWLWWGRWSSRHQRSTGTGSHQSTRIWSDPENKAISLSKSSIKEISNEEIVYVFRKFYVKKLLNNVTMVESCIDITEIHYMYPVPHIHNEFRTTIRCIHVVRLSSLPIQGTENIQGFVASHMASSAWSKEQPHGIFAWINTTIAYWYISNAIQFADTAIAHQTIVMILMT